MLYEHDIDRCFTDAIGGGGIERAAVDRLIEPATAAARRLRDSGLPLLDLPARTDDLVALREAATRFRDSFDDVVVLGTGGSSLGGKSLCSLPAAQRARRPRLHFMENVDPATFEVLFAGLDWARTGVLAISKSGGTAETMLQLLVVAGHLRAARGEDAFARQIVAISDPGERPLRKFAGKFSIPVLDHDAGIGGRFSALSVTGLLPAVIAGLDPTAIREGAGQVLDGLGAGDGLGAPPVAGAALSVAAAETRPMQVMLPYADSFASFARWYRQLWAESLGKGGNGTTPVDALGTVDQHSQLQLYLDGPADKLFTVLRVPTTGVGDPAAGDLAKLAGMDYLGGRRLGDLLDASAAATVETLVKRGRPVREITVGQADEATIGALMMHFMVETILAADLLRVDPFDQPAVEDGKNLARAYMERLSESENAAQ